MASILIADDDPIIRNILSDFLQKDNHRIVTAESGEKAIKLAQDTIFDVAIIDVKMDDINGIEVLEFIKNTTPDTEVIIITGNGSIPIAVQAMRANAYDFVTKPIDQNKLKLIIDRSLQKQEISASIKILQSQEKEKKKFSNIIGSTPAMFEVFDLIEKVCNFNTTVLITGESGTGKELVARTIHSNSPRRNFPFIPINCAAIPESLQETEFFGYAKGAFTGAVDQKIGLFEEADNGTIFLDEIGDASPSTQLKLLRFLEDGEIRRVGENIPIHVNARLITATNKDLSKAIAEGTFREDLYYRINVVEIKLPTLRERKDDIPLLAEYFLKLYSTRLGKKIDNISESALKILMRYDWPGNVRELQSAIQYSVAFANKDTLLPDFLPSHIKSENGKKANYVKSNLPKLQQVKAMY
ncbi:MAG: sigma-54-dependent transcriptional regulator, partial [Candidatus Poribacteria bacterium]